jgi:hypothetical protein
MHRQERFTAAPEESTKWKKDNTMHPALTTALRHRPILKSVSTVVLAAFLSLTLQPLAVAAGASRANAVTPPQAAPGDGADMARTLDRVHGTLTTL